MSFHIVELQRPGEWEINDLSFKNGITGDIASDLANCQHA